MLMADGPLIAMKIVLRPVETAARRAVDRILRECWVPYMHGHGGEKPSGYPKQACGGVTNYTSMDLDNVAAYESLDKGLAQKTDAVIASMTPVEQCAVHHTYLHAVYRFRRAGDSLEVVLDRALSKLEIGLRKRNVWLGEK